MSVIVRMFSHLRPVVDGVVNCPLHDRVAVEKCARCPWLASMELRHKGREAVYCRPRYSSLADLPPQ